MPPKVKFTKEQILSAAVDIVRERGASALTTRAIGERLGCSVAPVFSVFDNMENLYKEVVNRAKSIYRDYIDSGLTQKLPFKGAGLKYIEFAKKESNLFKLLFMSDVRAKFDAFMLLDDNNSKIIGALMSSWSLDEVTARDLHKNIMLFTHGIAVLCATNSCDFSDEEISNRLTFAFMSMLKEVKGTNGNRN